MAERAALCDPATDAVRRVLVVDDDAFIRLPLERLLSGQGIETHTADDGEQCLRQVTAVRPDLIIMDVMMPGPDGFETCRSLKADPSARHIPVLLLTGRDEPDDRARARESGAVDLMSKPYSLPVLLGAVRRLLGSE